MTESVRGVVSHMPSIAPLKRRKSRGDDRESNKKKRLRDLDLNGAPDKECESLLLLLRSTDTTLT